MEVTIRRVPAMRVACVRHIGPYNEIGKAFDRINPWARENGLVVAPRLGIFYDDPGTVAASELRSDAGVLLPEGFMPQDAQVQIIELPANEYAVATHVGGYESLGDAWGRLMGEWFPQSGRDLGTGPCFEMYLNDCSQVPKEQLVTELYQPVAPQAA